MDFYVMNTSFETLGIVFEANSKIWHKKYYEVGDFEIYINASEENISLLQPGYYVYRDDDDALGIIEDIKIEYNETSEIDMMIVTGRFSESIYDRRIVWEQTNLRAKDVASILRTLIYRNISKPKLIQRKIPNIYLPSKYDKFYINSDMSATEVQYTGDNILTVIQDLCKKNGVGFKHRITNIKNGKFYFTVYKGVDRSYNQTENPYVVFSDEYNNLIKSEYTKMTSNYKTTALVAGEGEGTKRIRASYGSASGLSRREIYVDKRDSSSDSKKIKREKYLRILQNEGKKELSAYAISEVFTGDARLDNRYIYKTDVDLGDICTVENSHWGMYVNSRVVGVIETDDENGYNIIFEFGS